MMKQLLAFLVFCIPIFVHAEVSLHEEIRSALKSGEKSIRLKHKEYFLEKPLSLNELNGIEIDGNHAKIVMKKNCACLIIIKSHDLTVRSLTIDYDPLPYTQGTVTKVDGKIIECYRKALRRVESMDRLQEPVIPFFRQGHAIRL